MMLDGFEATLNQNQAYLAEPRAYGKLRVAAGSSSMAFVAGGKDSSYSEVHHISYHVCFGTCRFLLAGLNI